MQLPTAADLVIRLLPMIVFSLPLAIGVFWLAPKMRSSPWIRAVLFLVPVVNLFAGLPDPGCRPDLRPPERDRPGRGRRRIRVGC